MGIKIINSFDLNSPLPLDARAIANNISEMNELITKNFVVAGQMCYNKADNKLYILKTNESNVLTWYEIADSVDIDNVNKVLPTDIAVKNNKLGLEHNNTWLTNQNAINLGANLEYDATTKTLNAKGGGGGESVSPTLNLLDFKNGTIRTTITEQEKINLEKGLYNQVIYGDLSIDSSYEIYTPSKLFYDSRSVIFANFDTLNIVGDTASFSSIALYVLQIGEKNTSGECPITIEKQFSINLGSGGGSSQPLELTGIYDTSNPSQSFKDITLTDDQVSTIKTKYENKEPLIIRVKYFPIENMGYAFDIQNMGVFSKTENGVNDYALTTLVSLNLWTTLNLLITIDTSTKTLSCREQKLLNEKETSLGIIEQNSELRINSSYGDTPVYIGESIYIDTINGKKILHTDPTINNYTIPTITFED